MGEKEIYSGNDANSLEMTYKNFRARKPRKWGIKNFFLSQERPGHGRSGTVDVIKRIYGQNGIRGLFTGLTPRLVKVAPACAIMIATFEHGKRFFQAYNANQVLKLERDMHWAHRTTGDS